MQIVANIHVATLLDTVYIETGIRQRYRIETFRPFRVQGMLVLVSRQERINQFGRWGFKWHIGVRKIIAIEVDHDRDVHQFRKPKGLQGHIDNFLMVFGKHLDPPGIALADGILMIVPD